jgi:hypothetical protein
VAGTALTDGSLLPRVVGNEADGFRPNAHHPAQLQVLALGVLDGAKGPVYASMNYAGSPSGAGVFAAGSTYWACALVGQCLDQSIPAQTTRDTAAITHNVIMAFSRLRAAETNPVQQWVPGPISVVRTQLPGTALGHYR